MSRNIVVPQFYLIYLKILKKLLTLYLVWDLSCIFWWEDAGVDRVDTGQTQERKSGRLLLTIFLVLLVAVPIILITLKEKGSRSRFIRPLQEGKPAPNFTFPDLEGRKVSLSDFRGKVVLVNIWATWCPPCRDEMPSMQKLYERFKGEHFEIVAVSINTDGREAVARFMQQMNLTFPALLDPKEKIRSLYGITGVPESFIVDREGILVNKVIGPMDWSSPPVFDFFQELIQRPGS
jgi:cytochrome c biogenesis protein CcmG/thiol:disulfide interchange protein DsbE